MRAFYAGLLLAATCLLPGAGPGHPQTASFGLGEIVVTGTQPSAPDITGQTLSANAISLFNRVSLDDAVGLMPGVSAATVVARAMSGWSSCAASTASRCR
jgi:iron complex outermembrane receptor protein